MDGVTDAELAKLGESVRGVVASCVAVDAAARAVHRAMLPGARGSMIHALTWRGCLAVAGGFAFGVLVLTACEDP